MSGLPEVLHLKDPEDMVVDVTVASPLPEKVDRDRVLDAIPFIPVGRKSIKIVKGGMLVLGLYVKEFGESETIVVANASVVVLVDVDKISRT